MTDFSTRSTPQHKKINPVISVTTQSGKLVQSWSESTGNPLLRKSEHHTAPEQLWWDTSLIRNYNNSTTRR
jgi:hypothetical protein